MFARFEQARRPSELFKSIPPIPFFLKNKPNVHVLFTNSIPPLKPVRIEAPRKA
jgi:hypothetical protein